MQELTYYRDIETMVYYDKKEKKNKQAKCTQLEAKKKSEELNYKFIIV